MTKLSDMQLVLLTTAATRPDGSLLPPPDSLGARADRIRRSVEALIMRSLADQVEVSDEIRCWRKDGAILYGVVISAAGRAVIAAEAPEPEVVPPAPSPILTVALAPEPASTSTGAPPSKIGQVVTLLGREDGATLAELVAATGWQPHTTRAALSGLRKKGHAVARTPRGDTMCYRLQVAG